MNAQLYKVERLIFSIIVRQLCSHKSNLSSPEIFKNYRCNFRRSHVLQSNDFIWLIKVKDIIFTILNVGLYNLVASLTVISKTMFPRINVDQATIYSN